MSKHLAPKLKADLLIIDDTPENLRLLNQILGKEYKVRLAPSGEKGLDAACSIHPDLILLDVMMPGLDGYEVAVRLKADEQTREIPIIFISALDDTESKVRGFTVGGVDYVTKPFQEQEVLARVHTHLSMHTLTRQLQTELAERKRVEEILRQREHDFSSLVENATDIIVRFDTDLRHIYCNPAVERQLGIRASAVLGKTFLELGPVSEQSKLAHQALQQALETGLGQEYERNYPSPFGVKYLHTRIMPERSPDGRIESILAITRDITERKRAENIIQARLRISEYATQHTLDELLRTALDELCAITDSPIGFFHFVEPDQRTLSLQAWSTRTLEEMCTAEGRGQHYNIDQAGVWVDCVREGHPVIHNDYASLPHRKGLPEGHAPVIREMVFPILREQKMVAVIGVGNKLQDYTDDDVAYASRLADMIWDIAERKHAEIALQESEARLGAIINNSRDGILVGKDGILVFANPAYAKMVGVQDPSELLGLPLTELAAPESRELIAENIGRRALGEDVPSSYEAVAQLRDGKPLPVELNVSTYQLGGELYTLAVIRDMTERKRAEEALRESEEKHRLLFDAAGDAIFINDEATHILAANALAEERLGYTRAEFLSMTVGDLDSPEQRQYVPERVERLIRQGYYTFETVHQRKDGSFIPTEVSSRRIYWNGALAIMNICRDITERKKMEQSLLQHNQEMATLYETSLEINALSDSSALLSAIVRRACALLNISFGVLYLVKPEEEMLELVVAHQLSQQRIGKKIRMGEGLAGQVVQTKKLAMIDDYQKWEGKLDAFRDIPVHRILAIPLKIHEDVIGVIVLFDQQVGVFSSEEVRLVSLFAEQAAIAVVNAQFADQLEKRVVQRTTEVVMAMKELESLSYTVSHDLRAPLRAIAGYSSIIQDEYAGDLHPESIRLLGLIRENAQVMGRMVDGLLNFMQLNRKALNIQLVEPGPLIQRALDELSNEQVGRQIEITIHEMPLCKGDGELLFNVWKNLLSNALKFSRPREIARIEVGCLGSENDQTVFYVKDNGVGFDMRYFSKLFKVFHRLHHTQEFEGIGMGLALAQRVILRHGGRIWAEAQEGQGATFFFTLGGNE